MSYRIIEREFKQQKLQQQHRESTWHVAIEENQPWPWLREAEITKLLSLYKASKAQKCACVFVTLVTLNFIALLNVLGTKKIILFHFSSEIHLRCRQSSSSRSWHPHRLISLWWLEIRCLNWTCDYLWKLLLLIHLNLFSRKIITELNFGLLGSLIMHLTGLNCRWRWN